MDSGKDFDFSQLIEDIKNRRAIEVTAGSHFYMGGVEIDEQSITRVPGLFAAGEVPGAPCATGSPATPPAKYWFRDWSQVWRSPAMPSDIRARTSPRQREASRAR